MITPDDPKFAAEVTFEPRDLWVGAYWKFDRYIWNPDQSEHWTFDVYVCLVPCLPIHVSVRR